VARFMVRLKPVVPTMDPRLRGDDKVEQVDD
jgi:hypothetical protein